MEDVNLIGGLLLCGESSLKKVAGYTILGCVTFGGGGGGDLPSLRMNEGREKTEAYHPTPCLDTHIMD